MGKHIDITGNRYGRLLVIQRIGTDKHGNATYLCLCDCGNMTIANVHQLKIGSKKSCGCLNDEIRCGFGARKVRLRHGESKTSLHKIWDGIKTRCYNKNNRAYKWYGAKGIHMCDEWKNSYENFSQWAKENGYSPGLTIERIDNNCDYCPSNCIWIPLREQGINKSTTKYIEYKGIVKTISDWARCSGINPGTFRDRLRRGWSIEEALNTPVRGA